LDTAGEPFDIPNFVFKGKIHKTALLLLCTGARLMSWFVLFEDILSTREIKCYFEKTISDRTKFFQ